MKVYGLWYGGYSYSPGSMVDDLERFDSIKAAKDALWFREESNGLYKSLFNFVNKPAEHSYTPTVGKESEMHIFFGEITECTYPDRIIRFGPRGGVRVERA